MVAKIKKTNKNQFAKTWKKLTKDFNWRAFVFNSLYYLVKEMPGWFCIYALAPWFLVLLSISMFSHLGQAFNIAAVIVSILIVHIISGFMANSYLRDKKKADAKIDYKAPTEYLAMSKKRFFILSLLSGSLYTCYWMYKNWRATAAATKEKIMPVFRGYIFEIFFIYPLFMRIKKHIELQKKNARILSACGILAIIIYFIFTAFAFFEISINLEDAPNNFILAILLGNLFIVFLYTLPFLPVQNAVNSYQALAFPEKGLRKKLTWGEYAVVIIGFLFCYVSYGNYIKTTSPMPYLSSLSQQQQVAIGQTIGHAYRNIQGYKAVCADSNFELKNYPDEFKRTMAEELDGLEQVLMRDNISLEQAFNIFIQDGILEQIQEELHNELKIISAPDDEGVASACQLLDADAADIAQNVADEIRPFYHEILTPLFKE